MQDIIETLVRWSDDGVAVALGSVVERIGSAPRDPGAALAVTADGQVVGGVTGGCVEPAVIDVAKEVLAGGAGRMLEYGLDDHEDVDVGLTCGGKIAVAVYKLDPSILGAVASAVENDRSIGVTVTLEEGTFGTQAVVDPTDPDVPEAVRTLVELGESGVIETPTGEKLFVEAYVPRPNMYLFGASDHVAALAPLGKFLGYRVTVCDPRKVFMTKERFPTADVLSTEWPDRFLESAPIDSRTVICMMTHHLKFDIPALKFALTSPAGFIGAIGSEKTRTEREQKLRAEGIEEAGMARLHAPIGIHVGARTPEEVAVSIVAQVIEANAAARASRIARLPRVTVLPTAA